MLGREPTLRSFLVCAAVVAGIALCELDKMLQEDRTVLRDVAGSSQITTLIGSLLGVLFCFISSVADTYNEKLLKTDPCEPLYLQNAKLCEFCFWLMSMVLCEPVNRLSVLQVLPAENDV
mmetsp:Transcript_9138/g.24791  ORF Transcript_9138/g.24791 Transcript_9138/m.24791 type:complete len:120 (+) Transcript_9138:718-1077(+)